MLSLRGYCAAVGSHTDPEPQWLIHYIPKNGFTGTVFFDYKVRPGSYTLDFRHGLPMSPDSNVVRVTITVVEMSRRSRASNSPCSSFVGSDLLLLGRTYDFSAGAAADFWQEWIFG